MIKVLLDENTAEDFEGLLVGFEVRHVHKMGWKGRRNGELLAVIDEAGFKIFITTDKQMRFQQNFEGRGFALVVLDIHPTSVPNQLAHLVQILALLPNVIPGRVYVLEGSHPKRNAPPIID